jgi:hypothetical protein
MQKICPMLQLAMNVGDQPQEVQNWAYTQFFLVNNTTVTQPPGIVQVDVPIMAINQYTVGDGLFLGTGGSGTSLRVNTNGSNDNGILVQDGVGNPPAFHRGLRCVEYGTSSNITAGCLNLERADGSTFPLEYLSDEGPTKWTAPAVDWIIQYWTGGNLFNIYQATTASSGTFWLINAGNNGGTFTGNFVQFSNGNVKFNVDYDGNIFTAATVNAAQFSASGTGGLTGTYNVRNAAGAGSCSLTFSGGILTAETC